MREKIEQFLTRMMKCVPIDNNLVAFESHDDFTDSSYMVFKALPADKKAIWLVYDLKKAKKEHPDIKAYPISLKQKKPILFLIGLFMQSRARITFYTHHIIGNPYKNLQTRVFITHASPPVKNSTGYFWDYTKNTCILATSFFSGDYRCRTFGGGQDRLVITGLPRNDLLFTGDKNNIYKKLNIKCNKTIVWMPTFKHNKNKIRNDYPDSSSNDISILTTESIRQIQTTLKKLNIVLIIKPHPAQDMSVFKEIKTKNIITLTNSKLKELDIQPYELLGSSDALITDFSSVYFDYLLCDRPIAFELSDKKKYEKGIGFIFDKPLDYMPGNKIYTVDDFCDFIKDIANNRDRYKYERETLLRRCHKYTDGNSSKRVINIFLKER